jgi:hypothetical protein
MEHIGDNYDPSSLDKVYSSHTPVLKDIKKNKTLDLHSAQLNDNESGNMLWSLLVVGIESSFFIPMGVMLCLEELERFCVNVEHSFAEV